MAKTRVLICGAAGKMGREAVKAVKEAAEIVLVGAVDISEIGKDAGEVANIGKINIKIIKDLEYAIKSTKAEVVVDFTHPDTALGNIKTILNSKCYAVVGTTGLSKENLNSIQKLCDKNKVAALIAPNFAIGAVLMMKFAREAAHYMPQVEIIELHHDKKADAPSGTAIKTADLILQDRTGIKSANLKSTEKVKGARGGKYGGINIHSIRLQGLVAHQEVIFGGLGQTLTLRHDTINRESFMPGVIMAIKKIRKSKGLIYGLENLL
ncbi:MAG: 4-hydroxy-tetrahydrodipicolinate reductase [bacterium]